MKNNYFVNSNNHKCCKIVGVRLLLFVFFAILGSVDAIGQVTITAPSLTITTCSFPSANATLGDIVIAESNTGDISTFGTIELTAPAGFEFMNQGSASFSGTDITSLNPYTFSSSLLTLTINGSGAASLDTITLSGIEIRAVTSASGPNDIALTGGSAVIAGESNGTAHATLTSIQNFVSAGSIAFSAIGDTLMCSPADPSNITGIISTGPGGATISYQWQSSVNVAFSSPSVVGTNSTDYNPASGLAVSTYYRRVATSTLNGVGCSAYSDTLEVVIVDPPTVTNASAKSICSGISTNISLTASASSSFSWTIGTITGSISGALAGSGGSINQVLTNPSNSLTGTVEYVVTPTSTIGQCVGSPFTITVTVYPSPVVSNAATKTICSGASTSIALGASVASGFSWTIGTITGSITGAASGAGANIAQTLTNPSNAASGSVEYIVTPTSSVGSCAGTPYVITVTVNPIPVVSNSSTKTICSGASTNISLIASAASSFSWAIGSVTGSISGSSASSGASIAQTLTNPSNVATGTVAYLVTPTSTSGSCVGAAYTITLTVNPLPAVTTASAATICSGTATGIALNAGIASSFSWSVGTNTGSISGALAGSGSSIIQSLTNPSTSLAGSIQYVVTPTSTTGLCVGANDTITVAVNPAPAVTTAATKTICSGASTNISLGASTSSNFSWAIGTISGGITGASAGSGAAINQALGNPSNTASGSVEYIVTPVSTVGTCSGLPYTITVTVNPTPVISNSASKTICSGASTNILLLSSTPSSFSWTIGTINGGITGASASTGNTIGQILTNPSSSATGTVDYLITPTSTSGSCAGAAYTVTVTVSPLPVVTTSNTATVCSGTSTNVSLGATVASSFNWALGTNTGTIGGALAGSGNSIAQTLTNPSSTIAGSIQYIVTPTSTTGSCTGSNDTITVTVNPAPIVNNTSTKTICSGASSNIALSATIASTYTWTVGTITGGITGASLGAGGTINQTLTNPSNTSSGSVQYLVTPTSSGSSCAGNPYTITVTVNPIPVVTNASTDTVCSGVAANIVLNSGVASSFSWTIGSITGSITGANASSGATIAQTLSNPSNAAAGSVDYVVTPTSTSGACVGASKTITVVVNPAPVITTSSTATICSGTATSITLASTTASSYSWILGTNTGGISGAVASAGGSIAQTLTNPSNTVAGNIKYLVTPVSIAGSCTGAIDTITVSVNPAPAVTTSSTKSICSGSGTNISLVAGIGSNFSWTVGTITGSITGATAGSGATINQSLSNPSNAVSGTVPYIVTPTSTGGSCTGAPYTITVTVNPIPVVTNSSTKTICSGTSTNINLLATAASSFSWTIGTITGGITGASASSGNSISQTLTNPSNNTAGSVQYLVTPTSTSGSCAGAAYTITVTVNPAPVITTAPLDTICSGANPNISLVASIASSFSWSVGTITGSVSGALAGAGSTINQTLTNPGNVSAGFVQYLVTPTSSGGSCVGKIDTITVTVNPSPVITNSATKTICSGSSVNIALSSSTASTYSWTIGTITGGITGASASSGNTISQVLNNPVNTTFGTVEYIVTPTSTLGLCSGSPFTITVTVNPTPVVTNASTKTICSGASTNILLASSVASNFSWTIGSVTGGITGASAGSAASINQVLTNPVNTSSGTVQYLVTPTSTSGSCVGAAFAITVTVNPLPGVSNATTVSICTGTNTGITLNASVASGFSWTIGTISGSISGASAGSGASIGQVLTNPSNSSDGTVDYVVTPTSTSGSCIGSPTTITVTVVHGPAVTNSATANTCSGVGPNISLTANEASTFAWTIGAITGGITGASANSGSTINQALTNPSNVNPGTVEYLITPTTSPGGCAGSVFYLTLTVDPAPLLTSATTAAACSGSGPNASLTSSIPGSFSWTIGTITGGITGASAGAGSVINQSLTNPSNSTAGTVEYIVTPTSTVGSCVGALDTLTVTVNVAPIAVITGGANQTVCSGTALPTPITFSTSNSIVGTTYAWTRDDTANVTGVMSGTVSISGIVLNNITTSPQTVTFTITPTGPAPTFCVGAPITTTLVIDPVPSLTSSLNPGAVCSGSTFGYTATSDIGGATYTWSRAAVSNISPGPNSGTGNVSENLSNSSTAPIDVTYIYQVAANGCTNPAQFSVVVSVNVYPSLSSSLTPSAICSGSPFNYTPQSLTPSTSFSWTRAAVSGISNAAGSGVNNPAEVLNDTLLTTINVRYVYTSTAGGCTNPLKDTVTVAVKPKTQLSSSLTPPSICSGSTFSYTPTGTVGGSTFTWSRTLVTNISNLAASGTDNPNEILNSTSTDTVPVTYNYTVTANGCSYNQNVVVVVNPIPAFTSTLSPPAICSGTNFSYTPASSTSGASFSWSRAGIIGISNLPSGGTGNPNETLINTTDSSIVVQYLYTVSANGCSNPATYSVNVAVSLVPTLSSSLSPPAICSGSNFSYTPTSSTAGTIFSWTRAVVAGITNIAGAGTSNPNEPLTNITANTINVEYVYTLTANGCTNPTAYTVVVPVYPTPALSSSLNPPAVCSGASFNYTATSTTSGASFSWARAQVAGISNVAGVGTGDVSEVLINTTTGPVGVTYVYTVSANGCPGIYNVNVTVNPIPIFTSTLSPAATCSGAGFNYIPSSSTLGATFTWSRAAITGISNSADTGSVLINEVLIDTIANPVNNVTYTFTVSANGCTNPGAYYVQLTVNPNPVLTSSLVAPAICSGTAFNYTPSSSTSGVSFNWTRNPVTGISNAGGSGNGSPNEVLTNTTSDSVNVVYVYSLTANGCTNPTSYSVRVAVNASPTLSSTLFPPSICSGTTFNYTPQSNSPNATFVWNRAAVSGIFNAAGAGLDDPNETLYDTTAQQQNVTYVYTVTSKTCSANTNVVVTVKPSPVLTSTLTPSAICSGAAFNYNPQSSTPGAIYSWSRVAVPGIVEGASSGNGNINEVLTNSVADPVNVTYLYTVTASGCTNSQTYSVVVTVYPVPDFTSSLTPPAVCSGIAFAYIPTSSSTGASFAWTRAAVTGISNLAGNGSGNPNEVLNNTTATSVNVTYVYTVSYSGCANPVKDSVVVNVLPTPTLTSTASPLPVCSFSTFNYVPTSQLPNVTFSWTRPAVPGLSNIAGSGTDSINEVLVLSDTIPVNVTYYFTLSTSSCTNPVTFPVVVTVNKPCLCNHQLTSTLTPSAICDSSAFSYAPTSSTSGATFSWTRAAVTGISNSSNSGNGNPNEVLNNTSALPVDVTYEYTVFAEGCANPNPFSVVVRVNPTPDLSSSLNPAAICSGSTFAYTPSSNTPGAIFAWTRAAVTGISNGPGNGAGGPNESLTNTTNAPVPVTYVYSVSANACSNATMYSVAVTVNPAPTLSSSQSPSSICSGSVFSYTPTSATSGTTFNWIRVPVSGISQPPSSGTNNPNETLTNLTTFPLYVIYYYTLQANGCSGTQSVTVTVEPEPSLSSSLETASVCSGTAFSYTPSSLTPGASFTWSRAAVAGISNIAGSGNGDPAEVLTNTSSAAVNVTYEYTVTSSGCSNSTPYSVIVTVNPIPTISSSLNPVTICSGTAFSYIPESSTAGSAFFWSRDAVAGISNPTSSGMDNPNEILYDTTTATVNTIYHFWVSANGCINPEPDSITVTVAPFGLSVDAGADELIEYGSSATLHGSGGASYTWSPITGMDNPYSANPVVSPLQTTTYTLSVSDGKGCAGIDSVTVIVRPDQAFVISSVMTPNGDGKNDTWIIVNIEHYPNTQVTIVNNQGQKIYTASNYQNEWDGTYNGKPVPDATYYYFLKFANNDKIYSGAISVFHDQK